MPAVRLTVFKYYTLFTSSIVFNGEIMSPYSYYIKKGLVCVIIVDLFSYQPFFCFKCTKLNTCALCNVYLVFFNKCMLLAYFNSH